MLHHMWGVRSKWGSSASMAMLSVDSQNAFLALLHAFAQSVLEYVFSCSFRPLCNAVRAAISVSFCHVLWLSRVLDNSYLTSCQPPALGTCRSGIPKLSAFHTGEPTLRPA